MNKLNILAFGLIMLISGSVLSFPVWIINNSDFDVILKLTAEGYYRDEPKYESTILLSSRQAKTIKLEEDRYRILHARITSPKEIADSIDLTSKDLKGVDINIEGTLSLRLEKGRLDAPGRLEKFKERAKKFLGS